MATRGQVAYFAHQRAVVFVGQDGDISYVDKLLKVKVLDCLKVLSIYLLLVFVSLNERLVCKDSP